MCLWIDLGYDGASVSATSSLGIRFLQTHISWATQISKSHIWETVKWRYSNMLVRIFTLSMAWEFHWSMQSYKYLAREKEIDRGRDKFCHMQSTANNYCPFGICIPERNWVSPDNLTHTLIILFTLCSNLARSNRGSALLGTTCSGLQSEWSVVVAVVALAYDGYTPLWLVAYSNLSKLDHSTGHVMPMVV